MSDLLRVATRKGLFTVERKGRNGKGRWEVSGHDFLAENVSVTMEDPRDGSLYAALDHGHFGVKVQRRHKGETTWEELPAPAYPETPEGFQDFDGFGRPLAWSLVMIWGLCPGGPDRPGEIWCGTIPGGVFVSRNYGASWDFVSSLWNHEGRKKWAGGGKDLPGSHHFLVDPRDSNVVRVGISCGSIWETRDGGYTWNVTGAGLRADFLPPERAYEVGMQDVHGMAHCAAHPDRVYLQHHNGMFASDDAAKTFTEITGVDPSTFGFAVVAHPRDKDKAWFVPGVKDEHRLPKDGALVVTRTSDGGKTFEKLGKGLPQRNAYDIVLRHALDIDASGDRLAFGSTTGGLWVSENGGDDWSQVDARLPPVYSVRFGLG